MISQISLEGVQYVRLGLWNYERAFWNRRIGVYWIIWCNRARRHDSSWSSLCMRKFIFSWNGEYNIHHGIYPLFLYDIKKIRFHLLAAQSSSFIFLYRIPDQSPSLNQWFPLLPMYSLDWMLYMLWPGPNIVLSKFTEMLLSDRLCVLCMVSAKAFWIGSCWRTYWIL